MSLIQQLTPINLLEEKAKFFADNSYNPQFIYEEPIDSESLTKHGLPSLKLLELAQEVTDETFFGRNEHELQMLEGKALDQDDVHQKISDFLKIHRLDKKINIIWSHSFLSRTTITSDSIKLRLPVDFRRLGLLGMLYHEIGTHALRSVNYEQQPWYKRKKKYGFSEYLVTEEGLASLHGLMPQTFPSAYTQAIRYLAVGIAQQKSFVEMWNYLGKYIENPERRWIICVREKRGIRDTSQPGGFTKDLVYFEGVVKMWRWLNQNNYRLNELYFGKLAVEDLAKAVELNPDYEPVLPSFYTIDPSEYAKKIEAIGTLNKIDQLK
jgi:hypothetical protein